MIKTIWINTQFPWFHSRADAPEEVKFLKNEHRHMFYVKVELAVNHDDRDIEFFIAKKYINQVISNIFPEHPTQDGYRIGSCEMACQSIYDKIKEKYKVISISVNEDNENWSTFLFLNNKQKMSRLNDVLELQFRATWEKKQPKDIRAKGTTFEKIAFATDGWYERFVDRATKKINKNKQLTKDIDWDIILIKKSIQRELWIIDI